MSTMKKLFSAASGVLLAASLAVATPVSVFANEPQITPASYVDSSYSFNFNGWFQRANTAWRSKDTTKSTYLHVVSTSSTSMKLYVDGAYDSGGSGYANLTNGGYVWSPGPGKYEIHNTVRESGRTWARLGASSDRGASSLNGWWSPDCRGSYTDLNGLV